MKITNLLISYVKQTGTFDQELFVQHWPLANQDSSADWLSESAIIKKSYGRSAMLQCVEVIERIEK